MLYLLVIIGGLIIFGAWYLCLSPLHECARCGIMCKPYSKCDKGYCKKCCLKCLKKQNGCEYLREQRMFGDQANERN